MKQPLLDCGEWEHKVWFSPDTKDIKRACDFLEKPSRKESMFKAIQNPEKLFRRANAFAAAGFDIRELIESKLETVYWKNYNEPAIKKWRSDFGIIQNMILLKKLEMLFPE